MKKKWIITILLAVVLAAGIGIYKTWFGVTKVAFVNFQSITMGSLAKANDNSWIQLREIPVEKVECLSAFDMVFVNGMGLRMVEEQRIVLQQLADRGIPVYTTMATNPANNICNLDSLQQEKLAVYLQHGGRRNYRNLLAYVRKYIDRKCMAVPEPGEAVERPADILYHIGVEDKDEESEFLSVAEYEKFLHRNGLYREGARKIVISGQMADATGLIAALEEAGYVVYPVQSFRRLLDFVKEIAPDAIINMAHGRLGDRMVEYLKAHNILLFSPLTVNSLTQEWENDPMGMSGGFLSQSVVTPEIDGAIRTYALFAQYEDKEGLRHSYAVPERLEMFVRNITAYFVLRDKPNNEKKVAVYYYKGPGQNALTASGMEVVPSLYHLLRRMKAEGYRVENLPVSAEALGEQIQAQGSVFGAYAEGAADRFIRNGRPEKITAKQYESWVKQSLRPEKYAEVVATYGEFPGAYMSVSDSCLALARLQFGNVVLIPQTAAAMGNNAFQVVHGANMAPPHNYIASYLWMQHGFKADALIHFGTHGSLEFTPGKQVALCSSDWSDCLVGALPHFYIYSIGNVGEGMIAKRRSYAGLQSYLTPPFLESQVKGFYRELSEKIKIYNQQSGEGPTDKKTQKRAAMEVKRAALKLGIHRELGLDSTASVIWSDEDIARVENFAEELAAEKITGQLYIMGVPYEPERIVSSVYAMTVEPIAYSLLALDRQRGKTDEQVLKHRSVFTRRYLEPAKLLVNHLLEKQQPVTDEMICRITGISVQELQKARKIEKDRNAPRGMMAMMMAMTESQQDPIAGEKHQMAMPSAVSGKEKAEKENTFMAGMHEKMKKMASGVDTAQAMKMAKAMGASSEALKKMAAAMQNKSMAGGKTTGMPMNLPHRKEYTKEEIQWAMAVAETERTIKNVCRYREELLQSPERELSAMINALNGGYTAPSPGGDPIANPNTLPTGRNLFAINAEETPTESAWEKGVQLAKNTIEMYRKRHDGQYPQKVSYTLWSGEFIETGGATVAQVLYMLGVEPVRDVFGRVSDLRLIPSAELGRPRVDVVVQTSGQLRDLAASRLFLINRAVEMAAAAKDDRYENQVAAGMVEAERLLTAKGISPKDAREMAAFRVFGGANGNYGTGIQGMVEAGDRWENTSEIAATYLNNMGAYYGSEKYWESFRQYAFEAALSRTDAVVQPRQSNTWGALSLDHVYEFMGGLNLAVREVTGKEPDAYFSDYRNRNHSRVQELKEAIGVESRTTLFNPAYIREKMKGESSSAAVFAETIRNTYGWNVMKPTAIDGELWDEIYEVYVQDKYDLGIQSYFERENPAALQEMTAVMLETARKGMWKASTEQLAKLVKLHTGLIKEYQPSCSGFVCDNRSLRDFIVSKADTETAEAYRQNISRVREAMGQEEKGMVMKKEELHKTTEGNRTELNNLFVTIGVIVVMVALVWFIRRKQKMTE